MVSDGLDREWAVNTVTEHYIDLLAATMGHEQFYSAEAAVGVIEQLVRALFDPVHGTDSIDQQDLLAAAARFHETGTPPPVSDGALYQKLASTAANAHKTFDSIMGAVVRRLGVLTNDRRLAPLFEGHADEDSTFDLRAALDEDCVIVLDMSGYLDRSRTLLSMVVLSQLWRALQRRRAEAAKGTSLPLVNCYIEEAADLAATGILDTLLSQGRGFDLSLTLAMQFPGQLRTSHPRVYDELLNDVGTVITGNIAVDDRLAERFATSDMPVEDVTTRVGMLSLGEWFVQPAAPFAERKPRPFVVASPPLPPGYPDGTDSSAAPEGGYTRAFQNAKERARDHHGVPVGQPASGSADPTSLDGPMTGSVAALAAATATIPHTERFPDELSYIDEPPYPLVCSTCETRYASTPEGMRRAIECHNAIADVDRDDIPVCSLDLQLTSGERAASAYSDAQLRLLTAVYMAHQQRFDPILEYDIVWDSMTLLEAYVGIETDEVQELLDDDLLRVDCRRPHKLYTVTPAGRDAIGIGHREGIAYGDGTGDLSESSLHVAMVEVGARLFEQEFVGPEAPGARVARYHGIDDGRLDVAVLDEEAEIVATLEAERINNDRAEAIPADFDKMAACDPTTSWWLVKARSDAHQLLKALHDPADDEPRVERTYSENMPPRDYRLDTAGLTDVYTFEYARDTLLEASEPAADDVLEF
jgi:hypothetical protein